LRSTAPLCHSKMTPVPDIEARWLSPEQTATYVGRRVDELPRLLRAGKLPLPSYHFGPRSPRYDRMALDALFLESAPSGELDIEQAEQKAVNGILERARRKKDSSGRFRKGIPLRQGQA
jgi:hypothetical protein